MVADVFEDVLLFAFDAEGVDHVPDFWWYVEELEMLWEGSFDEVVASHRCYGSDCEGKGTLHVGAWLLM